MKLTQDQIDTIISYHSAWLSDRCIARLTWHSRGTVIRYTDSRYIACIVYELQYDLSFKEYVLKERLKSYDYFHKFLLSATVSFLAIAILYNFI